MLREISLLFAATLLLNAGDQGLAPRPSASDYPVHQNADGAVLAAAVVPAKSVERMFSTAIARQYMVLEVAVYPQNGQAFNVDLFDFSLKMGDTVAHAEKPRDVATPWHESKRLPNSPVTVISEAGVVYGRTSDPNGHRSTVGVYEGVGVTNDPRASAPPPPPPGPDPGIEQRLGETMLPEGQTRDAVAGYLFFPLTKAKRAKGSSLELRWVRNGASAILPLPQK